MIWSGRHSIIAMWDGTYGLSFFVGGSEFFSLVLKTAQLDFELVKTAGQLGDVSAGFMQVVYRQNVTKL